VSDHTAHTLLATTDAMTWATEFCRIFKAQTITDVPQDVQGIVDEGTMLTWFANAIETGRNQGRRELCPHREMITLADGLEVCHDCGKLAERDYES
jgi:hypothetical protein